MSWFRKSKPAPVEPTRSWFPEELFGPWADHAPRCKCNVCR